MKLVLMGATGAGKSLLASRLTTRHTIVDPPQVEVRSHLNDDPAGAVLVISVEDGIQSETALQVEFARGARVPIAAVFLNEDGQDPELVELCELETRDLLTKWGYDGDAMPVAKGRDAVQKLARALDAWTPP